MNFGKNESNSKYFDIKTIPYAERQLIVVMEDEFVAWQRKSKNFIFESFDLGKVLKTAGKVVVGGYPAAIVMAGVAAYEAWERATNLSESIAIINP